MLMSTSADPSPGTFSLGAMKVRNVKMKTAPTRLDTTNEAVTWRAHRLPLCSRPSSPMAQKVRPRRDAAPEPVAGHRSPPCVDLSDGASYTTAAVLDVTRAI